MSMNVNYGSYTAARSARLILNGDINKDGTLDQSEIASLKTERNANGQATPWLDNLQRTGDSYTQASMQSFLENEYASANPADMITQGDANQDGVLTKDELIALKETRLEGGAQVTTFVDALINQYDTVDSTGQGISGEQINQFYLGQE